MTEETQEKKAYIKRIDPTPRAYLIGFIAGLVIAWLFSGSGGENTGYLMLISIVLFWYVTRKVDKDDFTQRDAIKKVAQIMSGGQRRFSFAIDNTNDVRPVPGQKDTYWVRFEDEQTSVMFSYSPGGKVKILGNTPKELDVLEENYRRWIAKMIQDKKVEISEISDLIK